jgi:outer membrane protein TolC
MVGLVLNRLFKFCYIVFLFAFFSIKDLYAFGILEAVEKIVNDSPELRIILEKREQGVAVYRETVAAYLPHLSVGLTREYYKDSPVLNPKDSTWSSVNKFELLLEQKIFDMESLSSIYARGQSVQSIEFKNQKLLESLLQLAVTAYYDVVQAEYLIAIAREHLRGIRDIEKLLIKMRNKGDATLADLNMVQARLANANSDFIGAAANLDKARVNLAYLLNLLTDNKGFTVTKDVLPELTNKDFYDLADKMLVFLPLSVEELQEQSMKNNADILYYRSELCSLGYSLEGQRGRMLPTVVMTGTLKNDENPDSVSYTRNFKLDLEARYYITNGGNTIAGIKRSQSALRELQYQYDQAVRDMRSLAYANFNQLRSLEQQRISILKEIEAAEEVDKVYTLQFKFAARNLTDRLDNLDRINAARMKLVSVDYAVLVSRIDILMQNGRLVEFFGFDNYLDFTNLKLC